MNKLLVLQKKGNEPVNMRACTLASLTRRLVQKKPATSLALFQSGLVASQSLSPQLLLSNPHPPTSTSPPTTQVARPPGISPHRTQPWDTPPLPPAPAAGTPPDLLHHRAWRGLHTSSPSTLRRISHTTIGPSMAWAPTPAPPASPAMLMPSTGRLGARPDFRIQIGSLPSLARHPVLLFLWDFMRFLLFVCS
jgi:hypothetical protein